jgi:hypothetical protein
MARNRWQARRKELDRPKASDAPPGYVYGYKRNGSLTKIADIEDWYQSKMHGFDSLPKEDRDWLNYKERN